MTALPLDVVEDFLKDLVRKIAEKCSLLQAILYGSYARGDARGKSDIDLLLIVREKPYECEEYAVKIASENGFSILQPIALTINDIYESDEKRKLYYNALLEGLVIYHSTEAPLTKTAPPDYEPCLIIRYKAPTKSVLKKLVGTIVISRGYKVRAKGLIEKLGGRRIGPGLVIVPVKREQALQQLFQQLRVDYQVLATILVPRNLFE